MEEPDIRKIKICLVGDVGVGKTSLVRRYVLDQFDDKYIATIGTKVTKKTITLKNPRTDESEKVIFLIWDIMGQPSFREILREAYFYGAQGALCVCDVTSRDSFNELRYWIKAMSATTGPVPTAILGNKCDLKEKVDVSLGDLKTFADKLDSPAMLTSAKTGENVEKAFSVLLDRVMATVKGF
jgi:small GTP-binding protein